MTRNMEATQFFVYCILISVDNRNIVSYSGRQRRVTKKFEYFCNLTDANYFLAFLIVVCNEVIAKKPVSKGIRKFFAGWMLLGMT